jgi:hypothetical protein
MPQQMGDRQRDAFLITKQPLQCDPLRLELFLYEQAIVIGS